jgi:hypothetical protein
MMNNIGCNVETAKKETYNGIDVYPGASIVLKPDFVCCPAEYAAKFPFPNAVNISARSTLILRGSGVVIESLDLDGCLVIDYRNGEKVVITDKVVQNAGWVKVKDAKSKDEIIRMRGYHIERYAQEKMEGSSGCTIM